MSHIDTLLDGANQAMKEGRWDDVSRIAKLVLDRDPDNDQAATLLNLVPSGPATKTINISVASLNSIQAPPVRIPEPVTLPLVQPLPKTANAIRHSITFPYKVRLSGKVFTFPKSCVCCGGDSNAIVTAKFTRTTGKKVRRSQTRGWEFPYCTACESHMSAYNRAQSVIGFGIIATVILFATGWFIGTWWIGIILGIIPFIWATHHYQTVERPKALALLKDTCCDVDVAVNYGGWDGSINTFLFKSQNYANKLAQANVSKLIR